MKQKSYNRFIFVTGISLALLACNDQGKKDEQAKTTESDTTANAKTEVAQPVAADATPDATTVSPALYKVLNDTMGIRVLEATYKPGDSSALHSHPDNALYVIEGGTAKFTEKDGTKTESTLKKGAIMIRPAGSHSVKNIGKTTVKVILVEANRQKETVSQDAALDATKAAPDLYKLKADSLGLRVVEAIYKPGQASALHSHPDLALYMINGGTAEFTDKDGKKQVNTLKTGATLVMPASTHSVKNTGATTMKVLLVEVNRPGK